MSTRTLDSSLVFEIKRTLDAAPHGGKDLALRPYAESLGMTTRNLRRYVRRQHGRAKECAGRPATIPDELVEAVWDEKVASMDMGLQRREIPTRIALQQLARLGVPGAEDASPSGINAAIRRLGLRVKSRVQRIEPDYALDVAHLDFSRSKYFQLYTWDGAAGDHVLRVQGNHLAYKEEDKVLRSWIVSVVDGRSRMARAKLYPATGEDASLALRALDEFWSPETAIHDYFHPCRDLWVDRGSAGRTEAFTTSLASVGVDVTVVQSKEAQGKVERQFRTLWSAFEVPLALELGEGATIHLAEYNERLSAFLVEQADWAHPSMPGTRRSVYADSLSLVRPDGSAVERLLRANLIENFYDRKSRTVDPYGCVKIDRQSYQLPERVGNVWIEEKMEVRIYTYTDGSLYASLVDHPGERPFQIAEGSRAASHPIGRAETPAEQHAAPKRRQRQEDRIAARLGQSEPSRPQPAGLDVTGGKQAPNIRSMGRQPERLVASGPREAAAAEANRLTGLDLRRYVGRRVAPYDLTYGDVADLFSDLERDPATQRPAVDAVLSNLFAFAKVA
jgi:hypothetical protein